MRLERIDAEVGAFRYYELSLVRSLLGGVTLLRRWGRIGAKGGAMRIEHHPDALAARRALRRWQRAKTKRGYVRIAR